MIFLFFISNIIYADNYILKTKKAHSYKEFLKYYKKVDNAKLFAKGKLLKNRIHFFEYLSPLKIMGNNNRFSNLSDPYLSEQDWLKLMDGMELINLSKGTGVLVGLLDSGVEKDHEDLKGQIIKYYNVADENYDIDDSYGHGTAVAGIISAIANNGNGIRGIAPESKLIVAKINSGASPTFDDYSVAAGIYYLVDSGVRVINMSIQMNSSSEVIEDAIDYAKEKGVVLIASSGNFGDTHESYPASNSYVLGVGSVNENFEISSFSNYDDNIFIFAPGENVLSTYINNNYIYESGTSFSAPMVTGLIADLLSLNPYLSVDDIKNIILESTSKITNGKFKIIDGDDTIYGSGVKIITNKNYCTTGDYLNLSLHLPPLSHPFDFYFGIITPDNTVIMLYIENGYWVWKTENNPTASNIILNNYYSFEIFGDKGIFPSLEISDNFLNGVYKFCSVYGINGNVVGYFNCKDITINQ